jgi:hypothetical protein
MGLTLGLSSIRAIAQPGAISGGSGQRPVPQHQDVESDTHKKRLIVLTDIGADPDDTQSMCRLLLYSSEIDIEGLIAATSIWRPAPEPELIKT